MRCEIDALFRAADIRTPTGARPRIHDIRHTFAVHALLRWYHRGVDPQAKLLSVANCQSCNKDA